VSAQKLTSNTL